MKNRVSLITILVVISLNINHCTIKKAEETRDKITFKSSTRKVEDSIRKMNNLMDKIVPIEGENINYFFDNEEYFYINSQKLGKINEINIDTVTSLLKFTATERRTFIALIDFLKENYISSTYMETCYCYLYDYHEVQDKSFKMDREIYLSEKGKNYETLFANQKILDKKDSLVLIGAK